MKDLFLLNQDLSMVLKKYSNVLFECFGLVFVLKSFIDFNHCFLKTLLCYFYLGFSGAGSRGRGGSSGRGGGGSNKPRGKWNFPNWNLHP